MDTAAKSEGKESQQILSVTKVQAPQSRVGVWACVYKCVVVCVLIPKLTHIHTSARARARVHARADSHAHAYAHILVCGLCGFY